MPQQAERAAGWLAAALLGLGDVIDRHRATPTAASELDDACFGPLTKSVSIVCREDNCLRFGGARVESGRE